VDPQRRVGQLPQEIGAGRKVSRLIERNSVRTLKRSGRYRGRKASIGGLKQFVKLRVFGWGGGGGGGGGGGWVEVGRGGFVGGGCVFGGGFPGVVGRPSRTGRGSRQADGQLARGTLEKGAKACKVPSNGGIMILSLLE